MRAAYGEWIAFIDDDCYPDAQWLAAIADAAKTGVDVIEGRTLIPDERDSPFFYAPCNPNGGLFWSCNLAIRRTAFDGLGGFDEDLVEQCEDMEFAYRLIRARLARTFRPDALVWHPMRYLGWRGIIRLTFRTRWHVMYALKTGQAAPLDRPATTVLLTSAVTACLNLARSTAHLWTKHDPEHWRTKWFWQAWRLVTFPLMLPYLLAWELKFRRLLASRHHS